MFIEMYQVEMQGLRKVIHYHGFTHARMDDGKPFGATEGTFCYVEIGDGNYRRACEEFELVQQYEREFGTAEELAEYEDGVNGPRNYLHMDDVTQDTPCGIYWFELDEA